MRGMLSDFLVLLLSISVTGSLLFLLTEGIGVSFQKFITMRQLYVLYKIALVYQLYLAGIFLQFIFERKTIISAISFQEHPDMAGGVIVEGARTFSSILLMDFGNSTPFALMTFAWAVGVILVLAKNLIKETVGLNRFLRVSTKVCDSFMEHKKQTVLQELGIKRDLPIYVLEGLSSPFITGIFHPRILIPDRKFSELEWEMVLRHELVHYKHRDLWFRKMTILLRALFWFNPLTNIFIRRFYDICELACDEYVLTWYQDRKSRSVYANIIMKLLKKQERLSAAVGMYSYTEKIMRKRLRNIIIKDSKNHQLLAGMAVGFAIMMIPAATYTAASCVSVAQDRLCEKLIEDRMEISFEKRVDLSRSN